MAARAFMGSGHIYINRYENGVLQGRKGPYEAKKFELQPSVETKEMISKGRGTYGHVIESVNIAKPTKFTMELTEVTGDVLVMAFLGTSHNVSIPAGTFADVPLSVKTDVWLPTGHTNLDNAFSLLPVTGGLPAPLFTLGMGNAGDPTCSAITTVGVAAGTYTGTFTSATDFELKNSAGAVVGNGSLGTAFAVGGFSFTLSAGGTAAIAGDSFTITVAASPLEGVDYLVNRPMGWVQILSGGSLAGSAVVYATGSHTGVEGTSIKGSTLTEVRAELLFDGVNMADGSQATIQIFEAVLSADSSFDFLADDFGEVSLSGNLKTPIGKTAPYEVLMQKV